MKVAELYAELGITIKDPAAVRAFEESLSNMAVMARSLLNSLRAISSIHLPRIPTPRQSRGGDGDVACGGGGGGGPPAAAPAGGPPGGYGPFARMMRGGQPQPGNPAFIGPLQQPNTAAAGNTAVAQSFKSIATFAKQLVGLGSLAYVIKRLVSGFVDMTKTAKNTSFATDKFGKATGLSREELLRWQYAAKDANVEEDAMRETLSALAQQAYEIRFGQHREAATMLAGWGLDLQQTADKVLEQFGKIMGNRSLNEALMVAKHAGISSDVAYMMHANKGIIPKLLPGQALDAKQQADTMTMGKSINALGTAIGTLSNKIVSEAAPAITEMVKGITSLTQLLTLGEFRSAAAAFYMGMPMGATAIPFAAPPRSQSQPGPTTYNNTNNIQIDGARDPKSIQREIINASKQTPVIGP